MLPVSPPAPCAAHRLSPNPGGISNILCKIDDVSFEGLAVVGKASLARKHAELRSNLIDRNFDRIRASDDFPATNHNADMRALDSFCLRWFPAVLSAPV